jgi:putative ABC transport system permease protein
MLKNHFKAAWRSFLRNRTFSIIMVAGLSIGLTVCMLIFLYTKDELSYDRFHENYTRLYRVVQGIQIGEDAPHKMGITSPHLGPSLEKEIPEITGYTRTTQSPVTVKHKGEAFIENPLFVDSNFFALFSFPLLQGDPRIALNNTHAIVLSEDVAKKYFGTADAIGKTLELKFNNDFEAFAVTAVAKNSPQNSSIRFDLLLPYNYYLQNNKPDDDWIGGNVNTFLLLEPRAAVKAVDQKIQALFDRHTGKQIAEVKAKKNIAINVALNLEPITAIHLGEFGQDNGLGSGGDISWSYILGLIALFILVVACINFINLAIARSLKRSKEIGVRKVIGSTRGQLIIQFLAESLFIAAISFTLALVLTFITLPFFNEMANKQLSLSYLADYKLCVAYILLLFATAFIAGFYPSLVLSSFQPVKALNNRQKLMGKNYFSRGLVVLQFTLAIFLIIATIAIYTQMNYLYHKDLGYDPGNLVKVDMPYGKSDHNTFETFSNELAGSSSVISIAGRNRGNTTAGIRAAGKDITIDYSKVNEQFFPVLDIPIIEGRNFSPAFSSDHTQAAIVNETFVKEAGWTDPVGQTISFRKGEQTLTIIGVIKDYHFRSLKEKITPQVFAMDSARNYGQAWIKINAAEVPATLASLQHTYKKVAPFFPFNYQFASDIVAKRYAEETKWKQIIGVAAVLFILIACMGLLGLVMLSIEQRTREIGIRKILGAAVTGIAVLIAKEFFILIGVAFLVALPAGYYAAHEWLQNFAYRIDLSWWIFALAGAIVILIALLTLGFHTIKTAIANPVKSLRTE